MNARAFFVATDGRPRAPWRLLLFLLLSAACVLVVTVALRPLLATIDQIAGIGGTGAAYGTAISLLLAHWMTFEAFDRRPWSFVGLHRDAARPRPLLFGAAVGAATIVAASLLLMAAGWLAVAPSPAGSWMGSAARVGLLLLPAALYEELLMRGYVFATLGEWLGVPAAVALTSVVFGLLHVPNPGTDAMPIVTVTLAGVYLATVLVVTRSLYAAWAAHFAWNFAQAALLHVPVSGLPMARPDYQIVDAGPDWATGGAWGPEGGAAAALAMMAGLAFLYWRRFAVWRLGSGKPQTQNSPPTPAEQHDG